jgi:UMF1 family MFS transporter
MTSTITANEMMPQNPSETARSPTVLIDDTIPAVEPAHNAPIASLNPAALPSWYPKFRGKPLYHGNQEALAWAFDGLGRAIPLIYGGAFFGTAIINLAKEAAGCETEAPPGETRVPDCNETVYGIRPSSILVIYTIAIGIISAALLPLMGAFIDYSPHRLLVGQITTALFLLCTVPQLFLSADNWFVMAIFQIFVGIFGWGQTAITYAYLPELTPDELALNDYTKSYTMLWFMGMILYLAGVIAGVSAAGYADDSLIMARVGAAVALIIATPLLYLAWWKLFQPRRALHKLRDDQRLWSAGFVQLYRTSINIAKNYRSLKWFYLAVSMSDAGLQALGTIAITVNTDTLEFTSLENGTFIICVLLGSVPGAMLANSMTRRYNPLNSSMGGLILLMVVTALFSVFVTGPGDQSKFLVFFFGFSWGVGVGWKWTCDRMVASSIIPAGQDAELMGFFLFSGQVLTWIPPLVFAAINQANVSHRIGVATLDVYFFLSFACYWIMGSYATARQEVNRETTFVTERREDTAPVEA